MAAEKEYFVHETTIVDDGVTIGKNTKIWCFSHILKNTRIGERCNIGQNCVIGANVNIGNGEALDCSDGSRYLLSGGKVSMISGNTEEK